MMLYFAKDGSYGDASDLTILNTEHWSEEDFSAVEQASDTMRLYTAITTADAIAKRRMLAAGTQADEGAQ